MEKSDFQKILAKSLKIVDIGIKKGYFKEEEKEKLKRKLIQVVKNGIIFDIPGKAVYGVYSTNQKKLYYNAKVYKTEQEALTYILHEMKHSIDEHQGTIGFEIQETGEGVGMNEGATQKFATDIAEEILETPIPEKFEYSLGILLHTKLDEYQIEEKMNELLCEALDIPIAEFIKMQSEEDGKEFSKMKQKFNQYANFDAFRKALDGIYEIQQETWVDEYGNLLENEAEPTKEQISRAKQLIKICQNQIIQYVEKGNPEKMKKITEEMIPVEENQEIMNSIEMLYQEDYLKYQEFIVKGLNLGKEKKIVYMSGLGGLPFEEISKGEQSIRGLMKEQKKPFTETLYIREGDQYKKIEVTFDDNGVIETSEEQEITSFDDIVEGIEHAEIIGNPEEYIRILQMQGKTDKIKEIKQKYEYFINNREKIVEYAKEEYEEKDKSDIDDILKEIEENSISVQENSDDNSDIYYNGKTITRDGLMIDEFGTIQMTIPENIIYEIQIAIQQKNITLTDEQTQTLKMLLQKLEKEKNDEEKASAEDFREIAENNQEAKEKAFKELKSVQKENDKEKSINDGG